MPPSYRCIAIITNKETPNHQPERTDTMKNTTIKDNITTYLLHTIGKDADLED